MRKLNSTERNYLIQEMKDKVKQIQIILTILKLFGGLQIGVVFLNLLFGEKTFDMILFSVIAELILFLFYVMLPGVFQKRNQWIVLLKAITEQKEVVYECPLLQAYRTGSGNGGAGITRAVVLFHQTQMTYRASSRVLELLPQSSVLLVCANSGKGSMHAYVSVIM